MGPTLLLEIILRLVDFWSCVVFILTSVDVRCLYNQDCLENLEGLGKIQIGAPHDVMTALIEYLTVLLEYMDLFEAPSRVGPQAKCPSCPSLSVTLYVALIIVYSLIEQSTVENMTCSGAKSNLICNTL